MKTGQKQRTKMKGSQIHMEEKLILAKNQIALIIWQNTILKSKKRKKKKTLPLFFSFLMFRVIYNFSIIFVTNQFLLYAWNLSKFSNTLLSQLNSMKLLEEFTNSTPQRKEKKN